MASETVGGLAGFDPKHVIALGLAAFGVLVWRVGGFRAITGALDSRAKKIADDLDQAKRLRAEAEALLASYKAKQAAAEAEVTALIEQAKADADALRRQAAAELEADLARRTQQAEERIKRAEAQAQAEVQSAAAQAAIAAAEKLLIQSLSPAAQSRLVEAGVKDLSARFT
jgi:F-type H+-transporting ATPase subunit b